jgi:hypothetical protein
MPIPEISLSFVSANYYTYFDNLHITPSTGVGLNSGTDLATWLIESALLDVPYTLVDDGIEVSFTTANDAPTYTGFIFWEGDTAYTKSIDPTTLPDGLFCVSEDTTDFTAEILYEIVDSVIYDFETRAVIPITEAVEVLNADKVPVDFYEAEVRPGTITTFTKKMSVLNSAPDDITYEW